MRVLRAQIHEHCQEIGLIVPTLLAHTSLSSIRRAPSARGHGIYVMKCSKRVSLSCVHALGHKWHSVPVRLREKATSATIVQYGAARSASGDRSKTRCPSRWASSTVVAILICYSACLSCSRTAETEMTPKRIVCIGDSIAYGVLRPKVTDPLGGYPMRLHAHLGDRATIINRGIPGTTTAHWLERELSEGLLRIIQDSWKDFELPAPSDSSASLLLNILRYDRPDIVIFLLGVNDLVGISDHDQAIDDAADRLQELVRQAGSVAPREALHMRP